MSTVVVIYPRCIEHGLRIVRDRDGSYVPETSLRAMLVARGPHFAARFEKLFGIGHTQAMEGPYPWDVEAVLERMASGRLIGSQAVWD